MSIGGQTYDRGLGTHAESSLLVELNGGAKSFSSKVGVDDEVNGNPVSSIEFIVMGDGKELWNSGVMHAGDKAKDCAVNLTGVKILQLKVGEAADGNASDHADWADAKFDSIEKTIFLTIGEEMKSPASPYILTPPAPATPRINGANVFGVRPGSPFLFTIPATGDRPMKFSASNLPRGLHLDAANGQITGSLKTKGEFVVTLRAKNLLGKTEKKLRIVCGERIALTPPMGWNSWNCFAGAVSQEKVKSAADAMVKSGLINHGWAYINVDDYWQNHRDSKDPSLQGPFRDEHGNVVPNSRFPDMKGMADYIHKLGFKAGLYSSPGQWTCGGCTGSWKHEEQDARIYATWGFDYLKYDWCSYSEIASGRDPEAKNVPLWNKKTKDAAGAVYPYQVMGKFLNEQKRDIVYSLCQYGMADVWKWGDSVNGNCWRTTGDIVDTWKSMSGIGFKQENPAPYAKPGNWNDPDMLIVGQVGWGHLHPTRLTADEQYTHISLWCLLSAPLLIGCDMTRLDEFTLNLLENDEVISIDQDELGSEARCVVNEGNIRVYKKELANGGHALGFFNLGTETIKWDLKTLTQFGFTGRQHVRDLWRQQNRADLDAKTGVLPLTIPGHGVLLYKLTAAD